MGRLKISTLAGGLVRDATLGVVAARLADAGFDGVEVPAPPPDRDPADIIREVTATGLKLVSVGTMANIPKRDLMNPVHTREDVRRFFAPSVRLARLSGAGQFQWCCMERAAPDESMEQFRSRLIDRLATIGAQAAEAGVVFLFEPLGPDSAVIATSTSEGVELVRAANSTGVRITFDTYHAMAAGEDVVASVRDALPWIKHVHLSDFRKTDRGFERPLPGRGTIDFGRFLGALAEAGYDGFVGIEGRVEGDDPYAEFANSIKYLRGVAPA